MALVATLLVSCCSCATDSGVTSTATGEGDTAGSPSISHPSEDADDTRDADNRGPVGDIEVVPSGPIVLRDPKGERAWVGTADRVRWSAQEAIIELTNVRCTFFEQGRRVLQASAPRARVNQENGRVVLSGGVRGASEVEDAQFEADEVEWDIATRRLVATGHITFVRGDWRVTGGERLEADTALRDAEMTGQMRFAGTVAP